MQGSSNQRKGPFRKTNDPAVLAERKKRAFEKKDGADNVPEMNKEDAQVEIKEAEVFVGKQEKGEEDQGEKE